MAQVHIETRKDELTYECEDGDTILRSALRNGIGFPYACNVGSCGNCKFTLLEGEVKHLREDPPALGKRDLERGRYLGCQAVPQGDCRIKMRPNDDYEPKHRPVQTAATLRSRHSLTHDIEEFEFDVEKPNGFIPGQYALLHLPGVEGGRAYSMCNLPGDGSTWSFQIKKVPGGEATTKLFDGVQTGDTINIDGPYGTAFIQEDSPRDIVCIAGGSGLSPMISIARAAAAHPELKNRRLDFIFGGRTSKDICGEDILKELEGFGDTIHFHAAISNPDDDDGSWTGPTGFVHDLAKDVLGDELKNREIYFAGPPAMAQAMQEMLFMMEVDLEHVHYDEFY